MFRRRSHAQEATQIAPLRMPFAALALGVLLAVAAPGAALLAAADSVEIDDGRTPPPDVVQRSDRIKAELARLSDHEWAGTYFEGDGLGVNIALQIAPDGGVSETWHGCLGPYGANQGDVRV